MLIRQIVASAIVMLTLGFIVDRAPLAFTIGMVAWIVASVIAAPVFGRWIAGRSAVLGQSHAGADTPKVA